MENKESGITITIVIKVPVEKCWEYWTTAADIMHWNAPSDDWHTPRVEIDLKKGGRFLYRMETKDGSAGFDHDGIYDMVKPNKLIEYTGTDGRKSVISFVPDGKQTILTETFEPGPEPSIGIQRDFCQGVLNNFKRYAESYQTFSSL